MSDQPDFSAQFREPERSKVERYMGGMTIGCGDHPTMPQQHRWSKVREFGRYRDRMCLNCSLTKGVDEKGRDL